MKTNDILDRNVRKESNSTRVSNKKQETIIVNSEVSSSAATFYTNSIADDIDEHQRSRQNRMEKWVDSMSIQTAETLDLLIAKFFTGPQFLLTL